MNCSKCGVELKGYFCFIQGKPEKYCLGCMGALNMCEICKKNFENAKSLCIHELACIFCGNKETELLLSEGFDDESVVVRCPSCGKKWIHERKAKK
jgi:hypothetical protein